VVEVTSGNCGGGGTLRSKGERVLRESWWGGATADSEKACGKPVGTRGLRTLRGKYKRENFRAYKSTRRPSGETYEGKKKNPLKELGGGWGGGVFWNGVASLFRTFKNVMRGTKRRERGGGGCEGTGGKGKNGLYGPPKRRVKSHEKQGRNLSGKKEKKKKS